MNCFTRKGSARCSSRSRSSRRIVCRVCMSSVRRTCVYAHPENDVSGAAVYVIDGARRRVKAGEIPLAEVFESASPDRPFMFVKP